MFNSDSCFNKAFWDGGATNLESQVFGPLTTHDEMAQNLYELLAELNAIPEYVTRFRSAFGSEITTRHVSRALAQFQRTLIFADSLIAPYMTNVTIKHSLKSRNFGFWVVPL